MRILSPLAITNIVLGAAVIWSFADSFRDGYSILVTIILGPILFVFLILDFIMKQLIKQSLQLLWIVEIVVILIAACVLLFSGILG